MEKILISFSNNHQLQYPPGIRFQPSDVELISYYLDRKVKDLPLPPDVITDIDLYTCDPWDLPRKTVFGEDERYFFTPRNRKYPNGGRPNRTAASGYWKATATDQPIFQPCSRSTKIGLKKSLVFYKGKPPNGHRTNWIMTEYRLPHTSRPSTSTGSMRLDDWVLCRIRLKGNMSKNENVKEPPSVCVQDCRDMLTDYLQSNEHNAIVSLLAGHDPVALSTPSATTISPRHQNHESSRPISAAPTSEIILQNFYLFSHSESNQSKERIISYGDILLPSNMVTNEQSDSGLFVAATDARSYGQHLSEGNKCKHRYQSNACISFQELDMLPALQENFMQYNN
ncbi:NAC domain containing protein 32 [Perilla frutescens var. hirtella]|uniref:NAC domain containing protein 32 n=1 Tax=Perilla frutescens var. hirtella TaxID=608512 RepID=A0AAD4P5V4_PERFH|nr:NAC domain containing protein 32 [Perilla frutescens var. hirtella]